MTYMKGIVLYLRHSCLSLEKGISLLVGGFGYYIGFLGPMYLNVYYLGLSVEVISST